MEDVPWEIAFINNTYIYIYIYITCVYIYIIYTYTIESLGWCSNLSSGGELAVSGELKKSIDKKTLLLEPFLVGMEATRIVVA